MTPVQFIKRSSIEAYLIDTDTVKDAEGQVVGYRLRFATAPGNPAIDVACTSQTFKAVDAIKADCRSVVDGDGKRLPARRWSISGLAGVAQYSVPSKRNPGTTTSFWRALTSAPDPLSAGHGPMASIRLLPLGPIAARAEAQQVLDLAEL